MGTATGNPTWEAFPSEKTPMTAKALNNIENALDLLALGGGGALAVTRVKVLTGSEVRPPAEFVVWWDTRPNLTVPDDAPVNMTEDDEWKIVGTVTVTPPDEEEPPPTPATGKSVYQAAAPGTGQTIHTDGGGAVYVGANYYATKAIRILGVRVWNPAAADATLLATDLTVFGYLRDYLGADGIARPTYESPLQQKAHTATRVAGAWTDILFDTPFTVEPINSAAGSGDVAQVAVQYAGGNYYITAEGMAPTAVQSTEEPGVYLAEQSLPRGHNSFNGGANIFYALDIIFEVV